MLAGCITVVPPQSNTARSLDAHRVRASGALVFLCTMRNLEVSRFASYYLLLALGCARYAYFYMWEAHELI